VVSHGSDPYLHSYSGIYFCLNPVVSIIICSVLFHYVCSLCQLGGINSSKVSAWAAHVYLVINEHGA
jgi:hypothetical protein